MHQATPAYVAAPRTFMQSAAVRVCVCVCVRRLHVHKAFSVLAVVVVVLLVVFMRHLCQVHDAD